MPLSIELETGVPAGWDLYSTWLFKGGRRGRNKQRLGLSCSPPPPTPAPSPKDTAAFSGFSVRALGSVFYETKMELKKKEIIIIIILRERDLVFVHSPLARSCFALCHRTPRPVRGGAGDAVLRMY